MGTAPSKNAPKTIILGANGCVGNATLESLLLRSQGETNVYAGVRDKERFDDKLFKIPTVRVDYENKAKMKTILRGFDRMFFIVPNDKNRTALTMNAIEAAQAAGIKYILMLSLTIADTYSIFGRQFKPIEDATMSCGIPYTIIRLPLFIDNNFAYASTVTKDNRICDPKDPREQYACVALEDVGKCAADILRNPAPHKDRIYRLVSQTYSMVDLSMAMTKILRRQIRVKEISFNSYRESLKANNIPEWQIDGLIEWLQMDYNVRITEADKQSIKDITGDNPTTINHFIASNAHHFGWKIK